jgi:polyhydroxybutyrate depolymerase
MPSVIENGMYRFVLAAVLGVCTVFGCARSEAVVHRTSLEPGRYEQTVDVGGVTRKFILRVPTSVDTSKPAPLVVVLHGWTLSAKIAETYTGMTDQAEKSGFIVAFPDGLGNPEGWNAGFLDLSGKKGDDVGFMSALLDKVESESQIDPDRVYVCGHSSGAFMSEDIGALLGNRLAAIGIVAGTIGIPTKDGGGYSTIPNPLAPISEIEIHSRKDQWVAYDKTSSAILRCVPAPDAAKWWAKQDGCDPIPLVTKNPDGTAETTLYKGGKQGTEVELVTLAKGSHDWPGGYNASGRETASGFDAAQALWDFFAAHPRRAR